MEQKQPHTEPKKRLELKVPNLPLWAKVAIMCVIVFGIGIGYLNSLHEHAEFTGRVQGGQTELPPPESRKQVADIEFKDSQGAVKKLSQFRGKIVLLSFWASWCTPCLVELPTFSELHNKLNRKGLEIIPINVDEPDVASEFVPHFWQTRNFPFTNFFDIDKKAQSTFEVEGLPANFVIDRKGRLVAQGFGANDWGDENSTGFMELLLNEPEQDVQALPESNPQ
ncbi:MAG: TlpA family protein disulfide reductase [Oligoflexia bacterium]|nr:TlpA family protein disulfide reductase [Oligoflexia bacterium]